MKEDARVEAEVGVEKEIIEKEIVMRETDIDQETCQGIATKEKEVRILAPGLQVMITIEEKRTEAQAIVHPMKAEEEKADTNERDHKEM